MQEIRYDGTEKITENVTQHEIIRAINNKDNKQVIIHKDGSVIKTQEGREYTVSKDGRLHLHPAIK